MNTRHSRALNLTFALLASLLAVTFLVRLGLRLDAANAALPRVADVTWNDPLPSVRLTRVSLDAGTSSESEPSFADLFPTGCGAVFFYFSTCGACKYYAPEWTGRSFVEFGELTLPLAWISVRQDTGRLAFVERYDLRGPVYDTESIADFAALGVAGTPTIYIIRRGILKGQLPATPTQIAEFANTAPADSMRQRCLVP